MATTSTHHSGSQSDILMQLRDLGQSIWLDTISRPLLDTGDLASLVGRGLGGVTSNPTIFEKAIADGNAYPELAHLLSTGRTAEEAFETVAVHDIQRAADLLRPTYDARGRRDGFVSLEVSPRLAHDTAGTIEAARRLWRMVDRPNLMVKIPATRDGIPAIAAVIADGINVNVTLLFAVERYREAANAFCDGLERHHRMGGDISGVASVASFFVSRVDTAVDPRLSDPALRGHAAIANARVAYGVWKELTATSRWQALVARGAQPQRLLWASTSVKNPALPPTYYVDALVGPETVNTVPMPTLDALLAESRVAHRMIDGDHAVDDAIALLDTLRADGIVLDEITALLEREGVAAFSASYDALIGAIEAQRVPVQR